MEPASLLQAENLSVQFSLPNHKAVQAVSDVSLEVREHEIMALVGESGCGKSTFGKALLRLLPPASGSIRFRGTELSHLSARAFRPYRKELQMVFQDPYASLDPRMSLRDILAEPLETYKIHKSRSETTAQVVQLLEAVGLSSDFLTRYPHQLSGGQRQRIGIARAIALEPSFLVCDEPVSALDISVQNQILNLLKDLHHSRGMAYLFISHDLSVVRFLADRISVMFLGKLCEVGDTELIYSNPLHPYTQYLMESVPAADPHQRGKRNLLQGELPSPIAPPCGCRFHTRCPYATEQCARQVPALREVSGRLVACHRYSEPSI